MEECKVQISGSRTPSTTRTRSGATEDTTRCRTGRISTTSTFLLFNSMVVAKNATAQAPSSGRACQFPAGTATKNRESAPSALEEAPTTLLVSLAESARAASGRREKAAEVQAAAQVMTVENGTREAREDTTRGALADKEGSIREEDSTREDSIREASEVQGDKEVTTREDSTKEASTRAETGDRIVAL